MRKCLSFILAVVLVCSTIWIGSGTDAVHVDAAESAIVKNGGFEETTAQAYSAATADSTVKIGSTGWYYYYNPNANKATMNADIVESGGRNGTQAMRVYPTAISGDKGKIDVIQTGITSMETETKYLLRVYAKAEQGLNNDAMINLKLANLNDPSGAQNIGTTSYIYASAAKADWVMLSYEFELPAKTARGFKFEIKMDEFTVKDAGWLLDDVSIVALPFIELSQSAASVFVGASVDLTKQLYDSQTPILGTDPSITWTSSDESVATVDGTGKVAGLKAGMTTITVTATNTADSTKTTSATCVVTVNNVMPTGIELDKTSAALKVGEETSLTATVLPENTTNKTVTWSSTDNTVATVDENGKVTAVGEGNATITAIRCR